MRDGRVVTEDVDEALRADIVALQPQPFFVAREALHDTTFEPPQRRTADSHTIDSGDHGMEWTQRVIPR